MNKDSQAETEVQDSTTADCTSVKPPYSQTPCYKQPGVQLYAEDCLETLRRMSTGSIDLLLQDMPYGVTQNKWDKIPDLDLMWEEWLRVTKPNGAMIFTAQQPFTSSLIMSMLSLFRYDIIWHKRTPSGVLNANKMPIRTHEHILIFYRSLPTFNPQKTLGNKVCGIKKHKVNSENYRNTDRYTDYKDDGSRFPTSVLDITGIVNNSNEKIAHPTQKPIKLMRTLIKTYSNENETVFDGYSGSGTTAAACLKENRQFIGSELSKEYFEMSVKRLDEIVRQPELFR